MLPLAVAQAHADASRKAPAQRCPLHARLVTFNLPVQPEVVFYLVTLIGCNVSLVITRERENEFDERGGG